MGNRKKKDLATIRRRVEDDGDGKGSPDVRDLDDDSFSEDSTQEEDSKNLEGNDSQTSEVSSTPSITKNVSKQWKPSDAKKLNNSSPASNKIGSDRCSDQEIMPNGGELSNDNRSIERACFHEPSGDNDGLSSSVIERPTVQVNQVFETHYERRRREHEEYKRRRQDDPSFVPNRGAFFMHDHRHSGPAANGFRPFSRGRGRGRLVPGKSSHHNSTSHMLESSDAPWTHDMHEIISEPAPRKKTDQDDPQKNNSGINLIGTVKTAGNASSNRALSVTKSLGIVQIRVALPTMSKAVSIPGIPVKQYTRLPDHRPPLRRDKPVRISLPDYPPRYIFPAADRSFIFIPRALRPNQQGFGGRRRGRSIFGTGEGYSRRTSVFDGSVYGSEYSPSVDLSRRSSLAHEVVRDTLVSPNGSVISRPKIGVDSSKPVVRLPPLAQDTYEQDISNTDHVRRTEPIVSNSLVTPPELKNELAILQSNNSASNPISVSDQSIVATMHQPKPQKAMSITEIESPESLQFNPPQQNQQPFHQQVPDQVSGNNYSRDAMLNSRNTSYPNPTSTATSRSQIPERAIHAQPFQPNLYQQPQQQFYLQPYQVVPSPHGYYCPPMYNTSVSLPNGASFFQPPPQQSQPLPPSHSNQQENSTSQNSIQSLVAQEVNGMVYYYDAAQIPAIANFQSYSNPQPYLAQQVASVEMGLMTPSPEGFYYTQAPQGMIYHPQ